MQYILIYTIFFVLLVHLIQYKRAITKDIFLVADRRMSGVTAAFSVAASWIWAPAVFISTKIGYEWGYAGLFWFCIPNFLALWLFAPFAAKVRNRIPFGYTYIEFIKNKSGHFARVQLGIQVVMQILIYALQITAGSELLSLATGAPYYLLVVVMAVTPLLYSFRSGLLAGTLTDVLQYIIMAAGAILLVFSFPALQDMELKLAFGHSVFDYKLLTEFGIPSALGLLFAIFADHQQWQRGFAVQQKSVVPVYLGASFLHLLFTFCMGTLGVLIHEVAFSAHNQQLVGAEYISQFMPPAYFIVFIFVALSALCSTLDSSLCAFSSLCIRHFCGESAKVNAGRWAMLGLCVLATALAFIRIPLITLWFIAGTVRLSAFAPTVFSIIFKNFSGRVGTLACLIGFGIGGSVFAVGFFTLQSVVQTSGIFLAWSSSLIICLSWVLFTKFIKSSAYQTKADLITDAG